MRLAAIACCGLTAASAQAPDYEEPIDMFAKLTPVITHARCMGCHGAVNPFDGTTHGGGVIDADFDWRTQDMNDTSQNRECLECHTAGVTISNVGAVELRSGKWKLAPRHVAFVGKDLKALCQQFAHDSRLRSHLMGDELIGFAFVGRRGDATESADPPPMTREELVRAADHWLEKGWGKCGRWKGTITQNEAFGSNYTYPIAGLPNSTNHVNETAAREFKLKREDGVTRVDVSSSGAGVVVQTLHLQGPNGPCTSIATSDGAWRTTTPANAGGTFAVSIAEDGSYTIRFGGPPEKGNGNTTGSHRSDCGAMLPPGGLEPPVQFKWDPWTFTIRCPAPDTVCQLFDPNNARLSGTITRRIVDHMDAADPQSWLTTSPAGISRSDDGATIPVTVTTTWDLELVD